MIKEKITYLITNYNNGKYVEECLESIKNQNSPNWACLIVDDASIDDSIEVINKFVGDDIQLIRNEENIGQIRSIMNMIELSETDIVCVVDSDDAIHADTTHEVINSFQKSEKIGFVYTNCIEYDESLKKPISIGLSQKIPFGATSSIINGHVSSLRCFRKSVYKKTSGYDVELLYAEDLDLGYKLEEVCLPYFLNQYLYKYRLVQNSRGREHKRKLLGYQNRKKAKYNAIKRRRINGVLYLLANLYVNCEFKKCMHSKNNHKFRKYFYLRLMILCKYIINSYSFESVKR